jgi:hypothetical protein
LKERYEGRGRKIIIGQKNKRDGKGIWEKGGKEIYVQKEKRRQENCFNVKESERKERGKE